MAPRMGHGIHVAVFITVMLAGCMSPTGPSATDSGEPPGPAGIVAPMWTPGDSWHYVNAEGVWHNWTVTEAVQRGGHFVYQVDIQYSQPTEHFATEGATMWLNRTSLGIQAMREDDGFGFDSEPPAFQLFPMVNRTYDIRMSIYPHDSTTELRLDSQVQGWQTLHVPAGPLNVVELVIHTEGMDEPPDYRWYSPKVGNLAQYEDEGLFQLSSWSQG